jgi:PTH1 family peptidyl-tRNA hydrolase
MDILIAGLGNPGGKYELTRHNIGFDILDHFAATYQATWKPNTHALTAHTVIDGKKVWLIKPETFMNLSGKAIQYWANWYKIPPAQMLIVVDDIALPVGKIRIRKEGSHAGHNGLRHIENTFGHRAYPRLKFGVGNHFPPGMQSSFVLSRFDEHDRATVNLQIPIASDAITSFIVKGLDSTMNQFNA